MAEVRRHFIVNQLDVNELNRVLAQIADRMDQLEGYRGQGDFITAPKSSDPATAGTELTRFDQLITVTEVDERASSAASSAIDAITTLTVDCVKVTDSSDSTVILHQFGNS